MKFAKVTKGLLLGLALLLATSAFAASDANKGSLTTMSDVTINGKVIPAGEYSLNWEGTGPNVQLNILKGKKVVATTPARRVDVNKSPASNAAVVTGNGDGSRSLSEVRLAGKKYVFVIGGEEATSEAGGASK
ncbi:MAG TPA: hypothetical protein VEI52_16460 [Terriglobales bacterium]|nr:hypothetical protein [Terriglobales bacterium]